MILPLLCGLLLAAPAPPDFFVSPGGDDAWSGRVPAPAADGKDGPFRSLRRARDAVRVLRGSEPARDRAIVVGLAGGVHELDETLVLGPEDSGTARSPVVYTALGGEEVVISGGRRISGWSAGDGNAWRLVVPEARAGAWRFAQLFVGDQRRFRSRLPARGWYRVAGELEPSPAAQGKGHDRFTFDGKDLREEWARQPGVEVLAIHIWSASRMRLAAVDPAARVVSFTGTTRGTSYWSAFKKGNRYCVENVREALDEPGEWFLDESSGELTYLSKPGETPERTAVVAPRLERLVVIAGDVPGRRWVEHVELRGLTFAHTGWTTPAAGSSFPQAEIHVPAAIELVGARDVTIDGCVVRHTGGYGVAIGAGSQRVRLERCELLDLGGGGVKIGQAGGASSWEAGQPKSDDPESLVSHNIVRDCRLAHGGRLHMAAVGVWIGHASHSLIDHNDIEDFYYTGVSVGWVWGYAPSLAHHNEIRHNRIRRIGQGVLSDMAGVYTLGVSPGTTVHHNRIEDVDAFDYGGWGLYTDEGSTGIVLSRNIVLRTKTGGFHQHYGKENVIENNILAFARTQQLQRTRAEPHLSFTLRRNIVLWDNDAPLLGSNWEGAGFRLERNLYWNSGGRAVTFPGGLDLASWQEKRQQDAGSLVADPRFGSPATGDWSLAPDSPALALGFEPWDLADVGRRGPPRAAALPVPPQAFD